MQRETDGLSEIQVNNSLTYRYHPDHLEKISLHLLLCLLILVNVPKACCFVMLISKRAIPSLLYHPTPSYLWLDESMPADSITIKKHFVVSRTQYNSRTASRKRCISENFFLKAPLSSLQFVQKNPTF